MVCDIYRKINIIKTIVMGCGCKNKGNQQPAAQPVPRPISEQRPQVQNQNVPDSVKKIVEKYYNKK